MIPDFKTYIKESTWGDIRNRVNGDDVRKEDSVNLLNRDEFYDYLKKRYSKLSHLISEDPSEIHITLGWSYFQKRDYKIDIHWVEQNKIKNLYLNFGPCELDSLCRKNFKIGTDNDGISNKEIISIIDFCLDYIKSQKYIESPIEESTWGDIRNRVNGDSVRRENMIITNEELTNKIKELYKEQGEGDTLNVSSLNKYKFDDLSYLFYNLEKVKQIIGLETWDVSNVTDMSSMFCDCTNLTELNISNWDVSNVTDMSSMFNGCSSLTELDISNWDVSNVTNMGFMFSCCQNLTELNISNWDVSNVTNMNGMFNVCENLTELNISNWDVSNVTNMGFMFDHCSSLTELNIDNWDVSNVTDMRFMFRYCSSLTELNISNWDVSNVTNMGVMFCYCTNLTELNISNWDVSNVTNMYSMFNHCSSLTELNISNWDVNNVTHMSDMFSDCNKLIKPKWYNE